MTRIQGSGVSTPAFQPSSESTKSTDAKGETVRRDASATPGSETQDSGSVSQETLKTSAAMGQQKLADQNVQATLLRGQIMESAKADAATGRPMTDAERTKTIHRFQDVVKILNSFGDRGKLQERLDSSSQSLPDISQPGDDRLGSQRSSRSIPGQDYFLKSGEQADAGARRGFVPGSTPGLTGPSSGSVVLGENVPASKSRSSIASDSWCPSGAKLTTYIKDDANTGFGHETNVCETRGSKTSIAELKVGGETVRMQVTVENKSTGKSATVSVSKDKDGKFNVEPDLVAIPKDQKEDKQEGVKRVDPENVKWIWMSLEEAIAELKNDFVDENVINPNPDEAGEGSDKGPAEFVDRRSWISQPAPDGTTGRVEVSGPNSGAAEELGRDRPTGTPEPIDPHAPGEGSDEGR